jgi:cysteine desulfurase
MSVMMLVEVIVCHFYGKSIIICLDIMSKFDIFIIITLVVLTIIVIYNIYQLKMEQGIKDIYLDNNATTLPPKSVDKTMTKWLRMGNSSSSYPEAKKVQKLINDTSDLIYAICNTDRKHYTVIYNSGASEGNAFAIRSIVEAYYAKYHAPCHVITSSIEHKSILDCVEQLKTLKMCYISFAKPNIDGIITAKEVESHVKKNTVLISVMYANNEMGTINDVKGIAKVAHENRIPFHCDMVQIFGKECIDIEKMGIDIATISFHKFYGPQGIGAVIMSTDVIKVFNVKPLIPGTQMDGLRGGTANIVGIAGANAAIKYNFKDRVAKTEHHIDLISYIIEQLKIQFAFNDYKYYTNDAYNDEKISSKRRDFELVLLGPSFNKGGRFNKKHRLSNTLLLAVCKNVGKPFCNTELKDALLKKGFIISIGSDCNTSSPTASHVITAMDAHIVVRRGVIRISVGDNNSASDVKKFTKALIACIEDQCKDILD